MIHYKKNKLKETNNVETIFTADLTAFNNIYIM